MRGLAAVAGLGGVWTWAAIAAGTPTPVSPPVVVTASRIDESAASDRVGAKVITAQDIARSRASSLSELLRSQALVGTRDLAGSPNVQIDLRGFGAAGDQNTLVLVDGLRAREYEQLTVNWAAIPLASIERIEILPAGSSVLYGGGTVGGTINIVTKRPAANARSGYLGAEAASYATREARLGFSSAGSNVGLRMQGSHYESDNYRDNQRVRIDNAGGDVRWTGDTRSLALRFGADDQRLGLPGVISEAQMAVNRRQAATPNDFATQRGGYVNLVAQTPIRSADLTVSLGYRQRDIDYALLVGTPLRNNVDTQVSVWTLAPRLQIEPKLGGWDNRLIVGADFEDWTFDADSQPTIPGQPHATQRSAALYAQHAIDFTPQTRFAAGARLHNVRYDVVDRARTSSAGERRHTLQAWDTSLRHALAHAVAFYAKAGSSFRVPNVNDNYNPFLARVTLLYPQTAREAELGVEADRGTARYRAGLYRIDLSNEIYFDPVTLGSRNRPPTRRQGLTLEARWQAGSALEIDAKYIYADATFRGGTIAGAAITGNRVPIAPRHTLRATLRWLVTPSARADLDVRHVSPSVFDADERNTFGREIPAYTVIDLNVSARKSGWLLKAGVRNLLGEEYFSYGVYTERPTYSAVPEQERSLFASAQYEFP